MEKHIQNLSAICRLCCQKIKKDKHSVALIPAVQFKDEILRLFNYSLLDDSKEIHPQHICNLCRRKLDNLQRQKAFIYEKQEIAQFSIHGETCICTKYNNKIEKHVFVLKIRQKVTQNADISTSPDISCIKNLFYEIGYIKSQSEKSMVYYKPIQINGCITVQQITVHLHENFMWDVYVFERKADKISPLLSNLPPIIDSSNMTEFIAAIDNLMPCIGNTGFEIVINDMISKAGKVCLFNKNKEVDGIIENAYFDRIESLNVIRHVECARIVDKRSPRCGKCESLRAKIITKRSRLQKNEGDENKSERFNINTRNDFLSSEQLVQKVSQYHQQVHTLKVSSKRMQTKMANLIEKDGISMDENANNLVLDVMEKDNSTMESPLMEMLWDSQKKFNKYKKATSMRWHPVIIRWCLSIYLKSPGTYEHLRRGGFLKLPHRTTLNQYTNFVNIGTGFHAEMLAYLKVEVGIENLAEKDRNVVITFDEMSIKSGLILHKGKLIGFMELGDINNELAEIQRENKEKLAQPPLASQVLTFMVRGITKRFNFPIGYYGTVGYTSDQLFNCFWETVKWTEWLGLKVRVAVCDGASPNRRFFKLHRLATDSNLSPEGVVYWAYNRFAVKRKIYFMSDPPHLIKTIRNNVENSSAHNRTRNLEVDGLPISWQHVVNLYEEDIGYNKSVFGVRKLTKLGEEHVYLNPRLRMRVYLAAEVLSKTVAEAMHLRNLPETSSTVRLIRLVDEFFDCLNVSQTFQGQKTRKPALEPYRQIDDWRFKWLVDVFLDFINKWKQQTANRKSLSAAERSRLCLSDQTIDGIRITVCSFVEVVPILLKEENIDYILSDRFNQDPLEEHFSKQRMKGGGLTNPTLAQYGFNERKIVVAKGASVSSMYGNVRGRSGDGSIDVKNDTRLPAKRPKKDPSGRSKTE